MIVTRGIQPAKFRVVPIDCTAQLKAHSFHSFVRVLVDLLAGKHVKLKCENRVGYPNLELFRLSTQLIFKVMVLLSKLTVETKR
jgi:hypothetical protein